MAPFSQTAPRGDITPTRNGSLNTVSAFSSSSFELYAVTSDTHTLPYIPIWEEEKLLLSCPTFFWGEGLRPQAAKPNGHSKWIKYAKIYGLPTITELPQGGGRNSANQQKAHHRLWFWIWKLFRLCAPSSRSWPPPTSRKAERFTLCQSDCKKCARQRGWCCVFHSDDKLNIPTNFAAFRRDSRLVRCVV